MVNWSGEFRAPLNDARVIPRPQNGSMPIWRAVGGHAASAIKAGNAGVPMFLATLGGPATSFKASIDAYRNAADRSGFDSATLPWGYPKQHFLHGADPHDVMNIGSPQQIIEKILY